MHPQACRGTNFRNASPSSRWGPTNQRAIQLTLRAAALEQGMEQPQQRMKQYVTQDQLVDMRKQMLLMQEQMTEMRQQMLLMQG